MKRLPNMMPSLTSAPLKGGRLPRRVMHAKPGVPEGRCAGLSRASVGRL